jgi:hypothetical protein
LREDVIMRPAISIGVDDGTNSERIVQATPSAAAAVCPIGRLRPAPGGRYYVEIVYRPNNQQGEGTSMKTLHFACALLVVLAFTVAAPAFAQTAPSASATNMEILAQKLKADKKLLVAGTMGLTDAESKAFWPIYDACQVELDGINKRLKTGIEGYAKDYNAATMTDAKAGAMLTEMFAIDEALLASRKNCAAKLNGVIPAAKITRYVQIENKIRAQINYELAAGIPFVQ